MQSRNADDCKAASTQDAECFASIGQIISSLRVKRPEELQFLAEFAAKLLSEERNARVWRVLQNVSGGT